MGNVLLTAKNVADRTKIEEVVTDSGVLISFDAAQVDARSGELYFCTSYFSAVAASAIARVSVTTTQRTPITFGVTATGNAVVRVYENSTVSGGTPANCHPYNLTVPGTPLATVLDAPTADVQGDLLATLLIPGGSGGNSSGGAAGTTFENGYLILDGPATYILEVQNISTSVENIQITLSLGGVPDA